MADHFAIQGKNFAVDVIDAAQVLKMMNVRFKMMNFALKRDGCRENTRPKPALHTVPAAPAVRFPRFSIDFQSILLHFRSIFARFSLYPF